MAMVTRMKIEHPRHSFVWSCELADWTRDETYETEWDATDEDDIDECEAVAEEVGGIIVEYERYSMLCDVAPRHILGAAE